MSYPGEGRGQEESGPVGDGQFVVSGGNAPPFFDLSEVVFHDVAALIRLSAQGGWSTTLGRIFGDVSTRFVMAQTSTVNPARRPRFCTGKRYLLQHGDAHQRDDLPALVRWQQRLMNGPLLIRKHTKPRYISHIANSAYPGKIIGRHALVQRRPSHGLSCSDASAGAKRY